MKPKTLILMVVAVTCGLVASYMTSRLLADRGRESTKVAVLVAKKTISQGDLLKIPEELFEERWFAQGDEPKLAITKALDGCAGNRTQAANRLGISVRTLQRKLRQYELERGGQTFANDVLTGA